MNNLLPFNDHTVSLFMNVTKNLERTYGLSGHNKKLYNIWWECQFPDLTAFPNVRYL